DGRGRRTLLLVGIEGEEVVVREAVEQPLHPGAVPEFALLDGYEHVGRHHAVAAEEDGLPIGGVLPLPEERLHAGDDGGVVEHQGGGVGSRMITGGALYWGHAALRFPATPRFRRAHDARRGLRRVVRALRAVAAPGRPSRLRRSTPRRVARRPVARRARF